ncbi:MAG: hypothetical protein LLG37_05165 [Spirochaetia bacterium]|nr:hypothetical protein [Spirochaetia bacterium]
MQVVRIRKEIAVWLALAVVIMFDNSSYAMNRVFHYTDFTIIAAVMLMVSGRPLAAFIFAAVSALIHDLIFMPVTGFSILSKTGALLFAMLLCRGLYRENYATRALILVLTETVKELIYASAVFIFYSPGNFRVPFVVIMKTALTVCIGLPALKLLDLNNTRIFLWPGSRKT